MPLQVEQQNTAILAEGGRKLEVLRAIKDFKKGIYGLQWEHKRSKLEVRLLRPAGKGLLGVSQWQCKRFNREAGSRE